MIHEFGRVAMFTYRDGSVLAVESIGCIMITHYIKHDGDK